MPYTTPIGNTVVIDDSNYRNYRDRRRIREEGHSTGYVPRDYRLEPEGTVSCAAPFPIPTIPRSEWADRIEELDKKKTRISDVRRSAGMPSSDQDGIPYCWIHGCVNALRLLRQVQGQPYQELEPTSAGALIKNYRKRGGNTPEAVRHLAEHGVATRDFWPKNSLSRSNDTPEMRENARRHRYREWWELRPNNFDQLITCLLLRFPVAIGLMWWGHMVCAMDAVVLGRDEFGVLIWNSWGDRWEDNGQGILVQKKATAFDQMCPRVPTQPDAIA